MSSTTRTILWRYGGAMGLTALAAFLRWGLDPLLGDHFPFITLFAAVVLVAWYAGRGPALLSLSLGAVAGDYYFLHPRYSFTIGQTEDQTGLALYGVLGVLSTCLFESLRNARRLGEEKERQLETEVVARRAAEQVLADEGNRLRTTLASIGDAVITTDAEGRITSLNAVAESLTGWARAEAVGQPLDVVFHLVNGETRQIVENPATRAVMGGVIVGLSNDTLLIARDGKEHPIDDRAAPIRGEAGGSIGCVLVFRDISDRRRLDNESASRLRAARLLAAIVESSDDAIISKTLDGMIQSWNAAAERLFGHTAEQAVGRHISLIIPADRIAEEDRIITTLKAGQRVEHYETVRLRCDGQPVLVSLTISPIKDETGQVIGASKIARDITGQRQAEERERLLLAEMATANAKFRAFFEQGALFAGIMDVDGTILEPNRLSWEGCGYTREQIVGKPFWEGPWWTPSPALVKKIKAASAQAAAGQTFRAEMPYFVADGSERMVEVSILPIKDEAGRVVFLAPTGTDITDRKRAEADRQKFVTLAESSTDFIGMCDLEGIPFYVNRAGLKLVGLDGIEQARRTPVRDFFFPEDQPRIMEEFFPSVRAKGHGEIEVRFRHFKSGEARWMAYKVLTLADATGQTVGFATVSQDVTERRELEDDLRRLAADLSEGDRRKNEFLATLAHELRNPLAPIRTSVQVMRLRGLDDPQLQWARDVIERQTQQMTRLVDDLLDISRITRGKIELKKEVVNLADVVHQAVETARPLIEERRHDLTLSVPPEPIRVQVDPARLEQILANLLNNAAKYTEPHGHIALSVEREDEGVALRVRDDGIGIPPALLPRVFDMFVQAEPGKERAKGGLGIGLSLVQRLVEMHDGRVTVSSGGAGQGSEFVVWLPVLEVQHGQDNGSSPPAEPPCKMSGRRILVVDDNVDAADSLALLLRLGGHQVRVAHDGEAALRCMAADVPDIIFLDIGLPGMSGYEVARRLRQHPRGEGMFLVALTGWGQEEDRRQSKEAGFDYHMVKPVNLDLLDELLATSREKVQL